MKRTTVISRNNGILKCHFRTDPLVAKHHSLCLDKRETWTTSEQMYLAHYSAEFGIQRVRNRGFFKTVDDKNPTQLEGFNDGIVRNLDSEITRQVLKLSHVPSYRGPVSHVLVIWVE